MESISSLIPLKQWVKDNFEYTSDVSKWFSSVLHKANGKENYSPLDKGKLWHMIDSDYWLVREIGDGNVELYCKRYTLLER